MPVVYVNQVGGNDQLVFDGSSFAMDAAGNVIASAASFEEDLVPGSTRTGQGDQHENLADECEAVYEALVLGTRDYIRKCGFRKVLIGLSGGIDSSLTAAIAVDAVGKENVTGVGMPGPVFVGRQRRRTRARWRKTWASASRLSRSPALSTIPRGTGTAVWPAAPAM